MAEPRGKVPAESAAVPGGFLIRPCRRGDLERVRSLYWAGSVGQAGPAFRQALGRPPILGLLALSGALSCLGAGQGPWGAAWGLALAGGAVYGACLGLGRASARGPLRGDLVDGGAGLLGAPGAGLWVAEVAGGGPVVGAVGAKAEPLGPAGSCEICRLVVDGAYRGRGLGRALLAAALEFARAQGYGLCAVYTSSAHRPALRLYTSAGFCLRQAFPPPELGPFLCFLCQVTDYRLTLQL